MAYTSIAVALEAAATITTTDRPYLAGGSEGRVCNLEWGPLSILVGNSTDATRAEAAQHLIDAATELRDAALARMAEPVPCVKCPDCGLCHIHKSGHVRHRSGWVHASRCPAAEAVPA